MNHRLAAAAVLVAAFAAACSGSSAPSATAAPITAAPPSVAASAAPATASTSAAPSMGASASAGSAAGGGYGSYGGGASASAAAASGSGTLALATTSLGSVLVGPTGMTLYLFMPDTSTTSACSGTCAATWPPLAGTMPSVGAGLKASDFGTIKRADGSAQISFHGHPLYYYAGDQAAGDTTGQGLFGKWYVVGSDGNPIK